MGKPRYNRTQSRRQRKACSPSQPVLYKYISCIGCSAGKYPASSRPSQRKTIRAALLQWMMTVLSCVLDVRVRGERFVWCVGGAHSMAEVLWGQPAQPLQGQMPAVTWLGSAHTQHTGPQERCTERPTRCRLEMKCKKIRFYFLLFLWGKDGPFRPSYALKRTKLLTFDGDICNFEKSLIVLTSAIEKATNTSSFSACTVKKTHDLFS